MMHGADTLARWNTSRTAFSLSPTYLLSSSGPLMAIRLAPLSLATALANSVLPQPGGPCSSTPAGMSRPSRWKISGRRMGSQMERVSSFLSAWSPPTCSHVMLGMVVNPSRLADGCTHSIACSKSCSWMASELSSSWLYVGLLGSSWLNTRLMANRAASFITADRSAPTNPGVSRASLVKSTSPARRSPRLNTCSIRPRAVSSGMPMAISRSNLPALLRAGSRASGRFVAPNTITNDPPSSSSELSICATILFSISLAAFSRFGHTASISSMNTREGADARAASNKLLTNASDSPDMPETISVAASLKKGTFAVPAMALASCVLPEPGGPWSSTPVAGCTPRWRNTSGCTRG
mmetsp:Transcript_52418/g.131771  ORF Transcript_52418/g.131771 Transcript_52418/m.131771 type:complete len:352 (-) Transcript_52418:14-1069(-)